MRKRVWTLAVAGATGFVWAALGCRSAPRAADAAPENSSEQETSVETVELQFGWEPSEARSAEVSRTVEKTGGEARTYRGRYAFRTQEGDEQLQVRVEPELEGSKGTFEGTELGRIVTAASFAAMPTMQVTAAGRFEGVSGREATRREYLEAARSAAEGSLPQEVRSMLERLLAAEVLETRSRQFWEMLVGLWAGESFELGASYEGDTEASFALPLVGRRKMPVEVDFGVRERVACGERPGGGGERPACVRASVESRPDVREAETLVQRWVDRVAEATAKRQGREQTPDLEVGEVFIRSEVEVVTHPADLQPESYREKRTIRLTLRAPDGTEKAYRHVDERQIAFE